MIAPTREISALPLHYEFRPSAISPNDLTLFYNMNCSTMTFDDLDVNPPVSDWTSILSISPPTSPSSMPRAEAYYPWREEAEKNLRTVFQKSDFRQNQREAIDETMMGNDGGSTYFRAK